MKFIKAMTPYVAVAGIGLAVVTADWRSEAEKFSTPEVRVSKSYFSSEDSPYFDVDFVGLRDHKDATLKVDRMKAGKVGLSVDVLFKYWETETWTKGVEVLDSRSKGWRESNLKKFTATSTGGDFLYSDVHALLAQAREYASSNAFYADASERLQPIVKQQGDKTLTTLYELMKGNFR